MTMMYEITIKADYERSWLDTRSRKDAIQYLKEELMALFPEHECSDSEDFGDEEAYLSFVGFSENPTCITRFESITDQMILDNSQDIIEGLNIEVRVMNNNLGELYAIYQCRQDIWTNCRL